MKILQLNLWTGRMKGVIESFIASNDFDIICLQEAVWSDNSLLDIFATTVDQIKELSGLNYDFRAPNWDIDAFDSKVYQGNAILSRIEMTEQITEYVQGDRFTLKTIDDTQRQKWSLQIAKLANGLTVVNHHGYWYPSPVGNEVTVESMARVASHLRKLDGPLVVCGDFNIIHESVAMRPLDFLTDLTYEHGIKNTLTGLKFNGSVACDHILVNNQIAVKDFRPLDAVVSDHKALMAEIDIA